MCFVFCSDNFDAKDSQFIMVWATDPTVSQWLPWLRNGRQVGEAEARSWFIWQATLRCCFVNRIVAIYNCVSLLY